MLKTFLPKAFRSEKTPSNRGYFNLENWIQGRIQDGTIDLGSAGGGDSIYTADGSIPEDRFITLADGIVLTFEYNSENKGIQLDDDNGSVKISADGDTAITLEPTALTVRINDSLGDAGQVLVSDGLNTVWGSALETQTLANAAVITIADEGANSLRFEVHGGSTLVLGHTNGGDTDTLRSYLSVDYDKISIGAYDADSETMAASLSFNTQAAQEVSLISSFGSIYIESEDGDILIGQVNQDPDEIRSYVNVQTNEVYLGVDNNNDGSCSIGFTDAFNIYFNSTNEIVFQTVFQVAKYGDTTRDALTPATGMVIYNTDFDEFQGYTGSSWVKFSTEAVSTP